MKKSSKKEYSNEDLGRYTGSLAERYEHDLKAIREGVESILKISKKQEKTLNSHSEQIAKLSTDMAVVKSDVKEIRADVKELRADNLEIRHDIKQIKMDIKFDLDSKIDKKHFIDLEGRVRVLEKTK